MNKSLLTALVTLLAATGLQAQDTVTTTTVAPTANLVASQPNGGSQYLVDAGRDPGQGQTFSLASDFTIEALTIQIGADTRGAQQAAEDAAALSLNVYEVPLDPATGEIPLDPVTGAPVLTLDAAGLLGSFSDPTAATFDATVAEPDPDTGVATPLYLTFTLDPASTAALGTLSANTLYAFTITSSSTTDPGFRIERSLADDFAGGDGIFTGGSGVPLIRDNDDLVFFLEGTMATTDIIVGDVDCSGTIDFLDIGPFIAVLSAGTFDEKADIDGSGVVDFLDIGPFIGLLSSQ